MRTVAFLFVLLFMLGLTADASLITVVDAVASSNNGGLPMAAVNGVGLGAQYPAFPATHTGANNQGWIGHGMGSQTTSDNDPWIHFDFGSSTSVELMRFWNYNSGANITRGLEEIDIYYSNDSAAFGDDSHASWGNQYTLSGISLGVGNDTTPYGEQFDLPDVTARYVRFDIIATHGAQPAFAEVQFITAVPEPSSILLVGVAAFAVGSRRRRRQLR